MIHITPGELQIRLQQQELFLIDVREPFEHETFNIGEQLIPLRNLISMAENIPANQPVIVYCKKGIWAR